MLVRTEYYYEYPSKLEHRSRTLCRAFLKGVSSIMVAFYWRIRYVFCCSCSGPLHIKNAMQTVLVPKTLPGIRVNGLSGGRATPTQVLLYLMGPLVSCTMDPKPFRKLLSTLPGHCLEGPQSIREDGKQETEEYPQWKSKRVYTIEIQAGSHNRDPNRFPKIQAVPTTEIQTGSQNTLHHGDSSWFTQRRSKPVPAMRKCTQWVT